MKRLLIIISLLIAIPSLIFAADRLIVKDSGGTDVFVVEDTGLVFAGGTDERNAFQMIIAGHRGGDSHTQMVTNRTNSRLTIMASTADDGAPRLIFSGPQDRNVNNRGNASLDYGSKNFDLPDAQLKIRHRSTTGFKNMMQVFGRDAVTFPAGFVGIGTTNPQHKIQVTTGGAFCDGTNWVDVSTRQAKDNIMELRTEEALETLKNIKPIKFNYKHDPEKETNLGFIAEDVPDLVATKGRKGMVSMEVVAVLTKVVQKQQEMIEKLTERIDNLEEK
jgi:hypothetical protein